jgi:hypothetical protein
MPWAIERKHDHVAVVTMNTNKQVARIERPRNPGSAASLAPDFVSLNPGYACYAC